MGFRQEIDDEFDRLESEKKSRQSQVATIRSWCELHDMPFSDEEADKILHPEDYDECGHRRHFT